MKVICITGTPAAGKTTLAKKLAKKMDFEYVDVNKIILKSNLSEGYDKARKSKIIDTNKLSKLLIKKINHARSKKIKGLVIDSHLSHYLPRKYVSLCIVIKCDISALNRRMKKRNYSAEKIKENLQAEIFEICHEEAVRMKHKIITVDGSKSFNIANIAIKAGG